MSNLEGPQGAKAMPSAENHRTLLKAAESSEVRENIERQRLSKEYRALQMDILEKKASYDQGIQSIDIGVNKQDPQAEALRKGLIELGRKINDEVKALEAKKVELKEAIEAMGGNVSDDTVH